MTTPYYPYYPGWKLVRRPPFGFTAPDTLGESVYVPDAPASRFGTHEVNAR
jgi:hypothetical protein